MATIHRLEANDPGIGGIAIDFGNNLCKQVTWRSSTPVPDTLELAKSCASSVLAELLREGHVQAADGTNWPSVVAACQKHISDWNDRLRQRWAAALQ